MNLGHEVLSLVICIHRQGSPRLELTELSVDRRSHSSDKEFDEDKAVGHGDDLSCSSMAMEKRQLYAIWLTDLSKNERRAVPARVTLGHAKEC